MGFKSLKEAGTTKSPTYRSYKLGENLVGEVIFPTKLVTELDWKPGATLEIMVGEDEDEGWFALAPSELPSKSILRALPGGDFGYRSRHLNIAGKVTDRTKLEFRVNGSTFSFKGLD